MLETPITTPITRFPQLSAPYAVILKRLQHHSATEDGPLYGLKINDKMEVLELGADDLPCISPAGLTLDQTLFAGAQTRANGRDAAFQTKAANQRTLNTLDISFRIEVGREKGMVALTEEAPYGLIDWVGKIIDAIETDTESDGGAPDSRLEGTCAKPILFKVDNDTVSEVGMSVVLTVVAVVKPADRGAISLTHEDVVPDDANLFQ